MTAAFSPAPQTTFRPRTAGEAASAAASPRRALVAVPCPMEVPEQLATVHELPVVHLDEVYRRRRLVVLAVVVSLLVGVLSLVWSGGAESGGAVSAGESVTVVVQPGDTLWGIAGELDPDGDPRALVARLTDLVGSTTLQPGQELVIPGDWLG